MIFDLKTYFDNSLCILYTFIHHANGTLANWTKYFCTHYKLQVLSIQSLISTWFNLKSYNCFLQIFGHVTNYTKSLTVSEISVKILFLWSSDTKQFYIQICICTYYNPSGLKQLFILQSFMICWLKGNLFFYISSYQVLNCSKSIYACCWYWLIMLILFY